MRQPLAPSVCLLSLLATLSSATFARAQTEPLPPSEPPKAPVATPPTTTPPILTPAIAPAITPEPAAPVDRPAERPDAGKWKPQMSAGAGLEAYWFSAKDLGSTFPLIPYGSVELSKDVLLDVHLPLSFATNAGGRAGAEKSGAGAGNPTLGITYVTTAARTTVHFGGRISAPLAGSSDEQTWQVANLLGAASMALYDLHYWAYKYLPIGMRAGIEYRPKAEVFLRGSIDPTVYAPVGTAQGFERDSRQALVIYQVRVEVEGRSDSGWGGGAGLQAVHAIVGAGAVFGDTDNAQGAIEPFVSYESQTTFARVGVLVALDSPLGSGFDKDKVASLRMNVGSHF